MKAETVPRRFERRRSLTRPNQQPASRDEPGEAATRSTMNTAQKEFAKNFRMPSNPRSLARDWQEAEQIAAQYGVKAHAIGKEKSYNTYGWVDWRRLEADILAKLA